MNQRERTFVDDWQGPLNEEYFARLAAAAEPADEPPPDVFPPPTVLPPERTARTQRAPRRPATVPSEPFPQPEDRGHATLSALGEVEYVEDLIRPGRIVVVAAEEGSGKSFAYNGELAIRFATIGGLFAGTWPVLETGRALVLSEMHPDDDYVREETVLRALGLQRADLAGKYYRLALYAAAHGQPALRDAGWRDFIIEWCRERGVRLAIVDTATGASDVDPWGRDIQGVFRDLRAMLDSYADLALVLVVHLKKPQGRGERRLSDVLGEWGRWCDVVMLMEADGLTRTKITVRKRVRNERRLVATKRDGLLIDPQDIEGAGPKVPLDTVVAAVAASPGLTFGALAAALGVSKSTAANYVADGEAKGLLGVRPGIRRSKRVYLSEPTTVQVRPTNAMDSRRTVSCN